MSSSAVVAAQSVCSHATLDDLRLGRSTQVIVGCLLRFWDSRNIKKNGEFMDITLLFLDEKNSVIHGFIPRADQYRDSLRTGAIVKVDRFEVRCSTNMYKIWDNPFVICFIPTTTIDEVLTDAPVINFQKFMLRKFAQPLSFSKH
ncbi:hypothetical protein Bca101_082224 [Brassica carinata]